jgi:hypothetical protein
MSITYAEALAKVGATVPEHLVADAEVPILTGPQAQGDLLIVPVDKITQELLPLPAAGIQVVFGEATGNSHYLHPGFDSPDVRYARVDDDTLCLAVVSIPEGQSAQLIHTDEHGSNGIGAGDYAIHAKRELREEITRVQD